MLEASTAPTMPFGPSAFPDATVIRFLPRFGRFIFRGRPRTIEAAGRAYGVALPQLACRAALAGNRAALWLGPDEWLLLLPESDVDSCAAALTEALAGMPCSLVDIGDRQLGIEIAGREATTLLNTGCPLDLDSSAFPIGMCTRTVLGKSEIVLWRIAAQQFRIEVWQSFAGYVGDLLREAQSAFRAETGAA